MVRDWIPTLGGRRFVLAGGGCLMNAILLWSGKIDGSTYATLNGGIFVAYLTANTTQKVQGMKHGAAGME